MAPGPTTEDLLVHRVLAGTYRLDERIGAGAMGAVYRARHLLLDQDFAVKVLAQSLADEPDVRRRFLLEARSLALFTHRNAVQVRHCGEDQGLLFLVTDLVEGETLASLLAREAPLPAARAGEIATQVLSALAEAHRAGIVHRDLKPGNVMIETTRDAEGAHDRVRVLDFGLARLVDVERAAMPSAFASLGGSVVGTVAYMSPEQLRASDDVDARSDLFSVGVVLHEMLSGAAPFPGQSTMSIALSILEKAPAPLPDQGPRAVPHPLKDVVARALEKDRDRRFATADEFAAAIRDALAGIAPPPLPPSDVSRVARGSNPPPAPPRSRARRRLAVLALVLVAAAGATLLAWSPWRPTDPSAGLRAAAHAALLDGRWAEAAEGYGRLVANGRATADDRLARAEARIEAGDPMASRDVEEASAQLPRDPRPAVLLARLARRQGKDAEAETAIANALLLDPSCVEARVERIAIRVAARRLPEAEVDVVALERDATDPRAHVQRSLLEEARAREETDAKKHAARMEAAMAAADRAVAADPKDATAIERKAGVLAALGFESRRKGDESTARARFAEALDVYGRAIDAATKDRELRGQGRWIGRLHAGRASIRYHVEDYEGVAKDYGAVLERSPRDPDALRQSLFASRHLGDFEKVIRDGRRLHEITNEAGPLFEVGFAYQQRAYRSSEKGDLDAAREDATKALEVYAEARALDPPDSVIVDVTTYGGETHVLLARLLAGEPRTKHLDAAAADFATALAKQKPGSTVGEILLRRSAMHAARGDARAALADVEKAVGDELDLTPRYYLSLAMRLLAVADLDLEAGSPGDARGRAARAAQAAERACVRMPAVAGRGKAVVATAKARLASVARNAMERAAILAEAESAVREADEAIAKGDPEEATALRAALSMARAEIADARGDPALAARLAGEAVATREGEREEGRWNLDPTWYARLAAYRARAGDVEGAATARERAQTVFPR